jgi:hypothetical protein
MRYREHTKKRKREKEKADKGKQCRVGTGQFSELVDQFSAENCQFELAVPPAVLRQAFD